MHRARVQLPSPKCSQRPQTQSVHVIPEFRLVTRGAASSVDPGSSLALELGFGFSEARTPLGGRGRAHGGRSVSAGRGGPGWRPPALTSPGGPETAHSIRGPVPLGTRSVEAAPWAPRVLSGSRVPLQLWCSPCVCQAPRPRRRRAKQGPGMLAAIASRPRVALSRQAPGLSSPAGGWPHPSWVHGSAPVQGERGAGFVSPPEGPLRPSFLIFYFMFITGPLYFKTAHLAPRTS